MTIPAMNIPDWFLWLVIAALYINVLLKFLEIYYESRKRKLKWQLEVVKKIKEELGHDR